MSVQSYPCYDKRHGSSGNQTSPTMQVATDLPYLADKDLDEVPAPRYVPEDITKVQRLLLHFVPLELADVILDMAEFWPYIGVSRNAFSAAYSALGAPDGHAQWCYLVTPRVPPLLRGGVPLPTSVRKVRFLVKTYNSCVAESSDASSEKDKIWLEASVLKKEDQAAAYEDGAHPGDWFANLSEHPRYLMESLRETQYPGAPLDNPLDNRKRWHITDNPQSEIKAVETPRYASGSWQEIVWDASTSQGLDFTNTLGVDDRVMLLTRALAPGWIQTVFHIKIEIYYALSTSPHFG